MKLCNIERYPSLSLDLSPHTRVLLHGVMGWGTVMTARMLKNKNPCVLGQYVILSVFDQCRSDAFPHAFPRVVQTPWSFCLDFLTLPETSSFSSYLEMLRTLGSG